MSTLAGYSSIVVARLLLDALPNFVPHRLLHFWPHCFHCIARYGKTPKQGARTAMADRLAFVKRSPLDLHIGFLGRHPAWRRPLATEDTPVHLSAQIVTGSCLFSLNLFVRNIASKLPPRCAASRARTCIHSNGPYESAWDRRVLVLVSCVILRCGYRRSLYTDSFRIPTLH